MRNKFLLALILPIIVLSVFSIQAQSDWERVEKKTDKQSRKKTYIIRENGTVIATPDQVIVRPALPSRVRPVRPVVVRPVAPRVSPAVRTNIRVYGRNSPAYSYRNYETLGNFEAERVFESNNYGNIGQVARLNGYRDGAREGATDARDGDAYNPFGEHAYRDGATGYISKYGNRAAYQQLYRQSFIRGYKESFERYLGNFDRRNW